MANDVRIYGTTTADGFHVKARTASAEHSSNDAWNTAAQAMRQRSSMFMGLGYLFLDSETNGMLDTNRIL